MSESPVTPAIDLPAPLRATPGDLPAAVAAALAEPAPGIRVTVESDGIAWSQLEWGEPGDRPLLLIHGVTASSRIWWRVGPGLAATGRRVVAVDLPGHGRTGQWTGRHRFRDNAADVARFARRAGLVRDDLQVVGHSWGAMTTATLPSVGLRAATFVLLDPPAMDLAGIATLLHDPMEAQVRDLSATEAAVRSANPTWSEGDVRAKADALVRLDREAVRAVLLDNGDWDAGLAALAEPAAAEASVWLVRGEPRAGGLVPDAVLPRFAERLGPERILTIADGPHAPQRTHPEATLAALLVALGG